MRRPPQAWRVWPAKSARRFCERRTIAQRYPRVSVPFTLRSGIRIRRIRSRGSRRRPQGRSSRSGKRSSVLPALRLRSAIDPGQESFSVPDHMAVARHCPDGRVIPEAVGAEGPRPRPPPRPCRARPATCITGGVRPRTSSAVSSRAQLRLDPLRLPSWARATRPPTRRPLVTASLAEIQAPW